MSGSNLREGTQVQVHGSALQLLWIFLNIPPHDANELLEQHLLLTGVGHLQPGHTGPNQEWRCLPATCWDSSWVQPSEPQLEMNLT